MTGADVCLLVDNSNTRTKFALGSPGSVGEVRVLPTSAISVSGVRSLVADWSFSRVCLCSVVPEAASRIAEAFAGLPLFSISAAAVQGVDFSAYPGVGTLGADRVANALAAAQMMPLPLVAVDLGTATTFEVLVQGNGTPRFAGGIIIPGFGTFCESLLEKTALLPAVSVREEAPVIGRTTCESMASGMWRGYIGMLDSLLHDLEQELGEDVHVVLTGGDAGLLAPHLKHACKVNPLLTLQGIALAAGVAL